MALARSIETTSGTEPYKPNSTTESGAHQIGKTPPGDGIDAGVLNPRKQQQKAENGLHIDGHHEKRIDVEIHQNATLRLQLNYFLSARPNPTRHSRSAGKNG